MSIEVWKDIPNYEGLYQVSNLGRVRGLDRVVKTKNGLTQTKKGKILKNKMGTNRYYYVCLYKNNKQKTFMIHTLVASNFIGKRPDNHDICHKNGDRYDNRVENLKYDTRRQNNIDHYRYGSKNPNGKLSIAEVLDMRKKYKTGRFTHKQIAELFNISKSQTNAVLNKHSYKWLNDDGSITDSKTAVYLD